MIDLLPALIPLVSRCRQDVTWRKMGSQTALRKNDPLTKTILKEHLRGVAARGVSPIFEGQSTTRVALLDLDSHKGETPWEGMRFAARKVAEKFEEAGYYPVAFRSTGGNGIHIFLVWDKPQDARSVREFLRDIIAELGFRPGAKGIAEGQIEIFPKQDKVEKGDYGNQFILPLAGKSVPLVNNEFFEMEPTTREEALNIPWYNSPPVPVYEHDETDRITKPQRYDGDLTVIKSALYAIPSNVDYDNWLKIGMALHAETSGAYEGFELWDEWSAMSPEIYPGREELEKKWGSFRLDKTKVITTGFIKKQAEEKGWQEDFSIDFEDVTEAASEPEKPNKKNRFKLIRADNYLKRPRVEWIIKGVLPRGKLGMTYGGSGDGKTFAILDMVCAVARGVAWRGRKTVRGHVVYICAEGAAGFVSRIAAYTLHHGVARKELGDYLTIIPNTPNFLTAKDVQEVAAEIIKHNEKTDLIVVDTLAQTTTGADENSAKDMNVALRHIEMLAELTGASCHLIHHAGKDESRGARGTSALKAPLDVQFHVSKDGDRRVFWIDKMKDGPDGFGWNFDLLPVQLGLDEDGEIEASCIAQYNDEIISAKKRGGKKNNKWEDQVMQAWDALGSSNMAPASIIQEGQRTLPAPDPARCDPRAPLMTRGLHSLGDRDDMDAKQNNIVVELSST